MSEQSENIKMIPQSGPWGNLPEKQCFKLPENIRQQVLDLQDEVSECLLKAGHLNFSVIPLCVGNTLSDAETFVQVACPDEVKEGTLPDNTIIPIVIVKGGPRFL